MRLVLLLLFLFPFSSAWTMGQASTLKVNNALIGKIAPDVVLPKSDGTSSSVITSRQGKKAILIFWATWCPHCYEDLGSLNKNIGSIEQKGVKIILVDIGETKGDVQKYFNRRQMKLISFIDENSFLEETYHLIGIPTLIFIADKGFVRKVTHKFPSDYQNYFN